MTATGDIGDTIVALLKFAPAVSAIVGDRVYPITFPDAPHYPAIVVNRVAGSGEYHLSGDAGVERARIQIDLYSDKGKAELSQLRQAVRRFLSGYRSAGVFGSPDDACTIQSCTVESEIDINETSTESAGPRLRRRSMDFIIINTEV